MLRVCVCVCALGLVFVFNTQPPGMQRAMATQAEAERERRAKVISAEGELQVYNCYHCPRLQVCSDIMVLLCWCVVCVVCVVCVCMRPQTTNDRLVIFFAELRI